MLSRRLLLSVLASLDANPVTALLGPRQVGKTTVARAQVAPELVNRRVQYLDLESPADLAKLDDPLGYLEPLLAEAVLIVIDEIQRAPGLFQVLRSLVDEHIIAGRPSGHFLLLGSASIDLLRQSSETLAVRISYLELCPLDILESEPAQAEALWIRGGFSCATAAWCTGC